MKKTMTMNDVREILKEYFGKRKIAKVTTTEYETIKIEGSNGRIYSELIKHNPANDAEVYLMKSLKKAMSVRVKAFRIFVCDPSIDRNGKLQFVPGFKPAVGYSYNELVKLAKENGLRLGTKFEYFLFLGTLISRLMNEGWSEDDAWYAVCTDSKELGHYWNSSDAKCNLEPTGSRRVAGKCDLANVYKILARDKKEFWLAGGNYSDSSDLYQLICCISSDDYDGHDGDSVGWFVI